MNKAVRFYKFANLLKRIDKIVMMHFQWAIASHNLEFFKNSFV